MVEIREGEGAGKEETQAILKMKLTIESIRTFLEEANFDDKRRLDLDLLKLREQNRTISLMLKDRKRRVQEIKEALDRVNLSKNGYEYEVEIIESQIANTRDHPSLYVTVQFGDEEERLDPRTMLDEHESMLRRLQRELLERKSMSEKIKSSHESLELARSRLVLKKKELEKIRDQLENVLKAADPFLISHSRLFADLQRTEEVSLSEKTMEKPSHTAALEKLLAAWISYCEQHPDIKVSMLDELEPGEADSMFAEGDDEDGDGDGDDDGDGDSDGDGESSATINVDGESNRTHAFHTRFASQAKSINRRFPFAHISVTIPLNADGDAAIAYFYPADPTIWSSPLVVRVELGQRGEMGREEREHYLLTLSVDPVMSLTLPHETVKVGDAGHVPFRWIQSLAGILPDASFDNVHKVLHKFVHALRGKSVVHDDADLKTLENTDQMQIDNPN